MGLFNLFKKEEKIELPPLIPQKQLQIQNNQLPNNLSINNPYQFSEVVTEVGSGNNQNPSNQPFFVRIDKFNEAKKDLIEIERKLRDMENILAKLTITKQKEDEEIESWKSDMKTIRDYLEKINDSIFNKL